MFMQKISWTTTPSQMVRSCPWTTGILVVKKFPLDLGHKQSQINYDELQLEFIQLPRISMAEIVSKLIFIQLDLACEPGPGLNKDVFRCLVKRP